MLSDFDTSLTADLARTLEADPKLSLMDAATRIARVAAEAGVTGLDERLAHIASGLRRLGVINPHFLSQDDINPHFFLANGQAGLFGQLIRDAEHARENISQYVVYGHWDSVLVLYGSSEQASRLMEKLGEGAYEAPIMFEAKEVLLSYRHRVSKSFKRPAGVTDDQINEIALDYDDPDKQATRDVLLDANVLIGPALTRGHSSSLYPINAFIGISVKARAPISSSAVLDVLMARDKLRNCMLHLFQVDHGVPYHYLAKIACATMEELDAATNAVALASHTGVRFEGETLVVAHGSEQLPLIRKPDISNMLVAPDVTGIMLAAQRAFEYLGPQERTSFNLLSGNRQLATLRALIGLNTTIDISPLDADTRQRLESAIMTFAREATRHQGSPNLTGAVVEITSMTEKYARRLLDRLSASVFGDDPLTIQRELKLPTRKIWNLALGKVVQAFRVARSDNRFADVHHHIREDWVDRLDKFADERNSWAHGAADGTHTQMIDRAFSAMSEGIQILAWLVGEINVLEGGTPAQSQLSEAPVIKLPSKPAGSDLTVFVSHLPEDQSIAVRLASGLDGLGWMGYKSHYADWGLDSGSSIVGPIKQAMHRRDVLLVVLSPKSVQSKWVREELTAELMRDLTDQNVVIIPILSGDCEIPAPISKQCEVVDFRNDFEDGFVALFGSLRSHRDATA